MTSPPGTTELPESSQTADALDSVTAGLDVLDILNFRNLGQAVLECAPGLNLITGENASGKTSLLEAIFYLGRVRSFRTRVADQAIRHGQGGFRLVGKLRGHGGQRMSVGLERTGGRYTVHLAGQPVRRLSDLAGHFPVQVFSSDTASVLSGGPRQRRHTLDWALFHVEPRFRDTWQRYTRTLRQRNAALRARSPAREITVWDSELVEVAGDIDRARRHYLDKLSRCLEDEMTRLMPGRVITVHYRPGWPEEEDLAHSLSAGLERDRAQGYTRSGPHRADFSLMMDDHPVAAHCSRGQQKAILLGLMLAQVSYQRAIAGTAGAFLLDDLTSELDDTYQRRVMQALRDLQAQVFVTTIQPEAMDLSVWAPERLFHVEHGQVHEVV